MKRSSRVATKRGPSMAEVAQRLHLTDLRADILRRYRDHGESQEQIGSAYGVDGSTISRWMDKLGISSRRWMLPPDDAHEPIEVAS